MIIDMFSAWAWLYHCKLGCPKPIDGLHYEELLTLYLLQSTFVSSSDDIWKKVGNGGKTVLIAADDSSKGPLYRPRQLYIVYLNDDTWYSAVEFLKSYE